jgi:predicted metal-dependent peptidase
MIRPGLIENVPIVGFVLDTSGSMGKEQLLASVLEAGKILEALGIDEVWFAEADAAIAMQFRIINAGALRKLRIHGGGGTDFSPALDLAGKLNPRPDILIYFTDGDGYAPAAPPRGMEVVWCIVPSYYNRRPAKWGHAVLITDDPMKKLEDP